MFVEAFGYGTIGVPFPDLHHQANSKPITTAHNSALTKAQNPPFIEKPCSQAPKLSRNNSPAPPATESSEPSLLVDIASQSKLLLFSLYVLKRSGAPGFYNISRAKLLI